MKCVVTKEIEYIPEAFSLLMHLAEEQDYAQKRDLLIKKYAIKDRQRNRFDLLIRIEKKAKKLFIKDEAQIITYFGHTEETDYLAKYVLLTDTYSTPLPVPELPSGDAINHYLQHEIRDVLLSLPEKEYCEKFGDLLKEYNNPIVFDTEEKLSSPIEVIRYLMNSDIPKEEKWRLQDIFLNREEHIGEVVRLVSKAAALLESYRQELEQEAEEFYCYWNAPEQREDFQRFMKSCLPVNLDENPLGLLIKPRIFLPNTISLRLKEETNGAYCQPDIYWIGILFGNDFTLEMTRQLKDRECDLNALEILKLLSDKSKFEILSYIRDKRAYGSELAKHLNLTAATISHHMNSLITKGLVIMEKKEMRIYYRGNKQAIENILSYCRSVLIGEE
ncbi:DNA-binding transcriptional ArsR family regulator [Anaerotaenia torta]|uniref:ArsR/SmtB family transcription factor n=1 Tax=Anaerotaenia torta TaxID=433293 RepID=UPI003D2260EA